MKHYVTFKNIGRDINIHIYIYGYKKILEIYCYKKQQQSSVNSVVSLYKLKNKYL